MLRRFFAGLGMILLAILKGIAWILLSILNLCARSGKNLPSFAWISCKIISSICQNWYTLRGGETMKIMTFAAYKKYRHLMKYFFAMRKLSAV